MIDPEFDTISLVVTSDRIANAPGNFLWHVVGRKIDDVENEKNKLSKSAVAGFAAFTVPRQLREGPFAGWFEVTGIIYDLA